MSRQSRGGSRGLIVGSLAGGVLIVLALVLFGPASTKSTSDDETAVNSRLLDERIPQRDPDQRVVISQNQDGGADPFASLQTGRGELEFTNDDGTLALRYRWDRSTPLKEGWNEFDEPRAWVYQSPQRLIYVTADQGRFQVAQNRQPQAGVLSGHVVLSLFEINEPQQTVYDVDPTTIVPNAQFETASMDFDLMRMLARTDERVVMRTADVIVAGAGMELLFNEEAGRIEKLEIHNRELIAYHMPAKSGPAGRTANATSSPTARADAGTPSTISNATVPTNPATEYELVLSDEVIIDQGPAENHTTIIGRELTAFFAAGKNDFQRRLAITTPAPGMTIAAQVPVSAPQSSLPLSTWLASAVIALEPSSDLTFLGSDDSISVNDVVISGLGSLLMTPLDRPTDRLTTPDDVYAILTGTPVRITRGDAYALGDAIEYSSSISTARLLASPDQPLEAGIIDGARLTSNHPFTFDLNESRGILDGGGTLVGLESITTDPPDTNDDKPARKTSAGTGLPTGFIVTWLEEFGVEFKPTEGGGLGRIAAASFAGSVHVDDPTGYSLDSGGLRIGFRDDEQTNGSKVDSVTATTNAQLRSTEGNVFGDELFVQFKPDANGESIPGQVTVTGNGRMETAEGTLESQYIQADLVESSLALTEAMPHELPGSESFVLKRLFAQGAVLMTFADDVTASADRLITDAVTDLATLTGESVVISDPTMEIIGKHVVVENLFDPTVGRVARVIGPGTMTYRELASQNAHDVGPGAPVPTTDDLSDQIEQPTDEPAADTPGNALDEHTNEIDIDWNGGFIFEEEPGLATFNGHVTAVSKPTPLETDTLTGDWMRIELTGPLDLDTSAQSTNESPNDRTQGRRLRKLTLIGKGVSEAHFDAVRYADADRTGRELLVAVAAEILEYTAPTEVFQALGPGWMLVVDGREKTEQSGDGGIEFSGPGETEFMWIKDMTLDGIRSRLTFNEEVVMRHRPTGDSVMRMDCQTLEAQFTQEDKAGVYDLSSRSNLDLALAVASGSVFVKREDRNVWADRVTFDREHDLATLEMLGDSSVVVIESESTGSVIYARRAQWNLKDDTVQADALRADAPAPIITQP